VMTIAVSFHQSGYRTFKHYYQRYVSVHLRWAFPRLVSYNRFIELMADSLMRVYLHHTQRATPWHFLYRLDAGCCLS
jgi:hypothetical protein